MMTSRIQAARRLEQQRRTTDCCREDGISSMSFAVPQNLGKRFLAEDPVLNSEYRRDDDDHVTRPALSPLTLVQTERISPLDQWMQQNDNTMDDDRTETVADVESRSPLESQVTFSSSIGLSDTISSISASSSVSKRPKRQEYSLKRLDSRDIENAMKRQCSCSKFGKFLNMSCHSQFNYGELCNLRRERTLMDQSAERLKCIQELSQAMKHPSEKVMVGCTGVTPYRECCIGGYILAYGLCNTTIYRLRKSLKMQLETNVGAGRPKKTREDLEDDIILGPSSPCHEYIEAWLNEWLEVEADKDPVGNDCLYTLDLVECKDVYEEFVADYKANTVFEGSRITSERSFKRVWDAWIPKNRIRIRDKKNTTTKCTSELYLNTLCVHILTTVIISVCEALKIQTRQATTKTARDDARKRRLEHRQDIRQLRLLYHKACVQAMADETTATLTIDGADSNKTKIPQRWQQNCRGEYDDNSVVEQRVMSVLLHGQGRLNFYVFPPNVSKGMDMVMSCIIDSLQYIPPSVDKLRIQVDGEFYISSLLIK